MASLVLSGDTSGSITVSAPAVAGSNTQTLAAVTGTLAPVVSGTAKAWNWNGLTTNKEIDFTDIPSWAKRITVMFNGVSVSGTSIIQIQLGDAGGIEATGYSSQAWAAAATSGVVTTGLYISNGNSAANTWAGIVQFALQTGNTWVGNGIMNVTQASNVGAQSVTVKTLSDTLTQIRITTVNGTDTFDAGTINILYE